MIMLLLWSPLATPPLYPSRPPLPFSLLGRHYSFSQIWALKGCSVWNCYNLLCLLSSFLFFKLMQGSDSFRKISQLGETVCITAHAPPRKFLLFLSITALDNAAWSFYVYWLLSTLFIDYCQQGPRPGIAIYWALPCVPGPVFGTSHISYNLETLLFLIQIGTGMRLKSRSCDSQRQSWNLDKDMWLQTSMGHSTRYTFYWSIVDVQCCASFWCTAEWLRYT